MHNPLLKLLQFLAFYLPFQIALNPTAEIDLSSLRVLIIIIFLFWLVDSLRKKKVIIPCSAQTFFVVFFLFLNFLSLFFARNPDWSIRKLLFIFSIFPIYFIFSAVVRKEKNARKISEALVLGGALAAALGIFQFSLQFFWGLEKLYRFWGNFFAPFFLGKNFSEAVLTYPSWLVNIGGETYFRAISFFPDPHMFSLFLGMLFPISTALFLEKKKKLWLLSSFLIILANILTFSRGAYFGLFLGIVFMFAIFWKKMERKFKITAVFLVFIVLFIAFSSNPVSSRFFSSFNFKEGSNTGRIAMWQAARKTILEKPFFGAGIGNFPLEVKPLSQYREPIYAHNTYLDIASETGILSVLSWIGMIFFALLNFLKKNRTGFVWLGMAVSLVIFSAHSLFETGLYSPTVLSLFLIIISLSNINGTCAFDEKLRNCGIYKTKKISE